MNRQLPHAALGVALLLPLAAPADEGRLRLGLDRVAEAASAKSLSGVDAYRRAYPHAHFSTGRTGTTIDAEVVARRNPEALARRLELLGAENVAIDGRLLSASVPVTALSRLDAETDLAFARPVRARAWRGQVVSQGDFVLRAPLVRPPENPGGPTGAGGQVGVLSDSFDCLGGGAFNDVANDEYNPVEVLKEFRNCADGSDEGRAMVQIVADVAPDANLLFRTAFHGQADFARGIRALADAGADVIVDDIGYFAAPYFHDGVIAQAADDVYARGVAYFSAAANSARMSYESAFRPVETDPLKVGGAGFAHDFAPSDATTQIYEGIEIGAGQTVTLGLQWDDAFLSSSPASPGAKGDLNLYLYNPGRTKILAASKGPNIGEDAVEILDFTNNGATNTFHLVVELYGGVAPTRIKFIDYGNGSQLRLDHATNSGTITGQPMARGAFAVGAAPYYRTPACGVSAAQLESFSSSGGTPILLRPDGTRQAAETREKPDATGPDAGNTSFFGYDVSPSSFVTACRDTDTKPNFFGTSAAAPHIAGVAALMREEKPTATPAQIYAALRDTASEMGPAGFDFDSGHGFVAADAAVTQIAKARPTVSVSRDTQRVTEGAPGTFSLKLNAPSGLDVVVTLALSGNAKPGKDYTAPALTVTIPAGQLSKAITIPTAVDTIVEGSETAAVTIVSATRAEVGVANRYKLTIRDPA